MSRRAVKSVEWRTDIPAGCMELAKKRTLPLLEHFGCNIRAMSIETLAASCYLQGIEDHFHFTETQKSRIPDYEI